MDKLDRFGAVNVHGKVLRKDDPLIASWLEGAKGSLENKKETPIASDDSLIDVIVEFIRMLLSRVKK